MIVSLLDKGWFSTPNLSPIESVYSAKFEDAVRLLSIDNAIKN